MTERSGCGTVTRSSLSIRKPKCNRANISDHVLSWTLALAFYFAAFGLAPERLGSAPPPHYLEQINIYSRPICIAFLLISSLLYTTRQNAPNLRFFGAGSSYVYILTFYFVTKTFVLGQDVDFFILCIFLVSVQFFVLVLCAGKSISSISRERPTRTLAVEIKSIAIFAVIFSASNIFVYFDSHAGVTSFHGRFFGIMINPQHLMMACVMSAPAVLVALRTPNTNLLGKAVLWGTLTSLGFFVYESGSRSGLVAFVSVLLIGYRDYFLAKRLPATVLVVTIVGIPLGYLLFADVVGSIEARFIAGRQDTRSWIWMREWREFLEYSSFGVGLDENNRLHFAEMFWLSVASNGGIVGILLALPIAWWLLSSAFSSTTLGLKRPNDLRLTMVAGSSVAILGLTLFESILAGLLTAHTMLAVLNMTISHGFLHTNRVRFSMPHRRPMVPQIR